MLSSSFQWQWLIRLALTVIAVTILNFLVWSFILKNYWAVQPKSKGNFRWHHKTGYSTMWHTTEGHSSQQTSVYGRLKQGHWCLLFFHSFSSIQSLWLFSAVFFFLCFFRLVRVIIPELGPWIHLRPLHFTCCLLSLLLSIWMILLPWPNLILSVLFFWVWFFIRPELQFLCLLFFFF